MILPIPAIAALTYRVIKHLNNAIDLGYKEFGQPEGDELKLLVSTKDYDVYVKIVRKPEVITIQGMEGKILQ